MNELMVRPLRPPVAGVCHNPMRGMRSSDMRIVGVDVPIADLVPPHEGPLLCFVNGKALSRLTVDQRLHVAAIESAEGDSEQQLAAALEQRLVYARQADNWRLTRTRPGDVIEWYIRPGREAVRLLLSVAIVVASIWFPAAVPYLIGLNAAYNLLVPPKRPSANQEQGDPIFSTALGGNQARLDQPIWKICGRVKITPPFAAQPYLEFLPSDPTHPEVDRDQHYYALFAVSLGPVELEKAFIGKTSIGHYQDVTVAQLLAPGTPPSMVQPNVTTSEEITSAEMNSGEYVGPTAASRPGDRATHIGVDVGASQGLGRTTPDGSATRTAQWQVEAREINDYGAPVGEWQVIASESRTADTNTPQRWSSKYELATPIRPEARVVRTDTKSTDANIRDGIQWIGLRAYLERPAPLNAHTSYYEVVMKASEQLNGQTSSEFSMIVRGQARTWDPVSGWSGYVFTRNPAWWLADLWSDAVWGLGLSDDRIDLQGLYEWSLTLDARQDHFDYAFTQSISCWDASQIIARAGRARPFVKNGVFTIARDEWVDLPRSAITPRIAQPKSMVLTTTLPKREQADGVIVEYKSNVTWDTATIECPSPGYTVTDPEDLRYDPALPPMAFPVYLTLEGVTGAKHAEREGLYQAYSQALRTTTVGATIEMEGAVLSYMDLVRWQPQISGYGQAGDVAFWNPATLVMGLTEPPDFSGSAPYLTLVRDDGSLTTPVAVAPGPTANDVTLPAAPDFELVLDDGTRERPKYLLGPLDTGDELAKIAEISGGGKTDDGAQLYDITAVVDVEAVHLADNHLLPGPGDIQDPIDDGADDEAGGGLASFPRLSAHPLYGYTVGMAHGSASIKVHADGTLTADDQDLANDGTPAYDGTGHHVFSGQWMTNSPCELTLTALYDVRLLDRYGVIAALISANPNLVLSGDPLDTWLPMTADRTWTLDCYNGVGGIGIAYLQVRRAAAPTLIQAEGQITLTVDNGTGDSGGTGGPGKVICTAMNDYYGLPNRESRIWLAYAKKHLQPEHQVGYHKVFIPLVRYAYKSGPGWTHEALRHALEWIAVTRTEDIKAELGGRRRRPLIRTLRAASEWLLLQIGRFETKRKGKQP